MSKISKKANNSKIIKKFFFQNFTKYFSHHPLSANTSFKFQPLILFEIWHLQNFISIFSKGRNFTRGYNSKKICVCYFSMRNPYMKLQDDISFRNIIVAKFQGPKFLKKGNNSKNITWFFLQFFIKYFIHHPLSADTCFKFLAIILFEIRHLQKSSPCLSKSRNLTRGDNSGKTKNMRRLFFHEKSIHEVSRRYLDAP